MKGLLEITADIPKHLQNVPPELKNTLAILDMVRFIGVERFYAAENTSVNILYALLPEDSQWLYLTLSSIIYYCMGKLDNAEHCMRIALILDSFKHIEPSRGFILLFLSVALTLKNQRECLLEHIAEILAIGEKYNYKYLSAHGSRLAAFERYLSHEAEASGEMLGQAVFLFLQINNKAMAAACRLLRRL